VDAAVTAGDEAPRSAGSLASRLELDTPISDLSSRFISLRPEQLEGEINDALRRLSGALDIDLAVLWR
jgi:hypothetical protein